MSRLLKRFPLLAIAFIPPACSRPGSGIELPSTRLDPARLVATISRGDSVDLEDHLVPGTWTLLEFGADW